MPWRVVFWGGGFPAPAFPPHAYDGVRVRRRFRCGRGRDEEARRGEMRAAAAVGRRRRHEAMRAASAAPPKRRGYEHEVLVLVGLKDWISLPSLSVFHRHPSVTCGHLG